MLFEMSGGKQIRHKRFGASFHKNCGSKMDLCPTDSEIITIRPRVMMQQLRKFRQDMLAGKVAIPSGSESLKTLVDMADVTEDPNEDLEGSLSPPKTTCSSSPMTHAEALDIMQRHEAAQQELQPQSRKRPLIAISSDEGASEPVLNIKGPILSAVEVRFMLFKNKKNEAQPTS